jgi:hypothetical protein
MVALPQYRISIETPEAVNPTRRGGWDDVGGLDGDLVITGKTDALAAARRVANAAPRTAQVILFGPLGRKNAKRRLVN